MVNNNLHEDSEIIELDMPSYLGDFPCTASLIKMCGDCDQLFAAKASVIPGVGFMFHEVTWYAAGEAVRHIDSSVIVPFHNVVCVEQAEWRDGGEADHE